MPGPLKNIRHERFCQEIMKGKTHAEAYRLADFKAKGNAVRVGAAQLLTNPNITARLAELKAEMMDEFAVSDDRIIREMAKMGFGSLKNYADLLETGDLRALSDDHAAALTEMTIDTLKSDGEDVRRVKIKMADKLNPLVNLAKMRGMFNADQSGATNVTFNLIKPEPKRIT